MPQHHPPLFDPVPSPAEREERARELAAITAQLQAGNIESGLDDLELLLARRPGDPALLRTFRQLERELGEEYRVGREAAYRPVLDRAWGTDAFPDTVLKLASFWSAPFLMEDLRKRVFAHRDASIPPPSPNRATETAGASPSPRVSIVVPVYNDLDHLNDTLASVLAQTVDDWELLLIDDGSKSELKDAIALRADRAGPRARVITHEQNRGLAAARNTGTREARGEFVVWLDADDLIAPSFLADTLAAAEMHPRAAWIAGVTVQFGTINRLFAFAPFDPRELVRQNQFNCTVLLRKPVWEDVGGLREEMRDGLEDWDFWVRAMARGHHPVQLKAPLFFYRRRDGSMLDTTQRAAGKSIRAKRQLMAGSPDLYRNHPESDSALLAQGPGIPDAFIQPDTVARLTNGQPSSRSVVPPTPTTRTSSNSAAATPSQRVLFVCHDFPPHRYAGAQLYALQMAKRLQETGVQVDIFHPVFRGEQPDDYTVREDQFEGLPVFKLGKPAHHEHQKFFDAKAADAFSGWLQSRRYDLVHVHGLGQLSTAVLPVLKQRGLPVIMTLHDFWLLCDTWHMVDHAQATCSGPESVDKCAACYLKRLGQSVEGEMLDTALQYQTLRKRAMKDAFAAIDIAVAPSQYLANTFAAYGMPGVRHHPNGLIHRDPVPNPPRDRVTFGYFGQIIPRKGIDLLVRAFQHPDLADCRLEIHGKTYADRYGADLKRIVEPMANVTWHGPFQPEQLPGLYATVDMAVVPSRMDNYPTTILEARMQRTPVIGSRVGGIPEMIDHGVNGLLFDNESVESLQEMLLRAVRNPGEIGTFRENLVPPRTVEDDLRATLSLYSELTGIEWTRDRSTGEEDMLTPPMPPQQHREAQPSPAMPSDRPVRTLIYFFKNVHIPILLPIYEEMVRRGGFEVAFGVFPYNRGMRAGMSREEQAILEAKGVPVLENPRDWRADVTLMADNVSFLLHDCGKLVNVGHGLLSKGQYFTNSDMIHRENLEDLLCVPGPYAKERLDASGRVFIPVVATGMAKLDRLFSPDAPSRDELMRQAGLDPGKRVVLFAPTFNISLSAVPILWSRVARLADASTYLLIKLHGSTLPEFKDHYRELAARHENVIYVEDPDLTPSMIMADVMVSDVSSAFMEFMALDKPVVLFDNPNQSTYVNYDPNDIEYTWRDLGLRAGTMEEVEAAVTRSLENPRELSEKRRTYAEKLLADRSGQASRNIVDAVQALLAGEYAPARTLRDAATLLIPVAPGAEEAAAVTAHKAVKEGGDRLTTVFIDRGGDRARVLENGMFAGDPPRWLTPADLTGSPPATDYLLLAQPGVDLSERRAFRLLNHLRRDPSLHAVAPLFAPRDAADAPEQNVQRYLQPGGEPLTTADDFDRRLRASSVAQRLPRPVTASSRVIAVRRESATARDLLALAAGTGLTRLPNCSLAGDVVAGFVDGSHPTNRTAPPPPAADAAVSAERSPAGTAGRLRMALHFERKGRSEKAAEHARAVLAEDPDNTEASALLDRVR